MKKMMLVLGFVFVGATSQADSPNIQKIMEAQISQFGTPEKVVLTTYSWTKVPTYVSTSSLKGRSGVEISNPSTNSASVVGHLGNCTSTSVLTTVRPFEITKGNNFTFFPINNSVCLWLMSVHTSTESVHSQEVEQQ